MDIKKEKNYAITEADIAKEKIENIKEYKRAFDGIDKRMNFFNTITYLVSYKYPDYISEMFPDKNVLNTLIVVTLVYISYSSLGASEMCPRKDIEQFIRDVLPIFIKDIPKEKCTDTDKVARYILITVLQHGGELIENNTLKEEDLEFDLKSVRIINEKDNHYFLTENAYDFIFKSKEIDTKTEYSVAKFKMLAYLERDDFEEAKNASEEIILKLLNMKRNISYFIVRCKENLFNIDSNEYHKLVYDIQSIIIEENNEMKLIKKTAEEKLKKMINEAFEEGLEDEAEKHKITKKQISRNIQRIIDVQGDLLLAMNALTAEYGDLVNQKFLFSYSNRERINFKKDLLTPLYNLKHQDFIEACQTLLGVMMKPKFAKKYDNLEELYDVAYVPENTEEKSPGIDFLQLENDIRIERLKQRNERYVRITKDLLNFAHNHRRFSLKDYVESLDENTLYDFNTEVALPFAMQTLYGMGNINLEEWKMATHYAEDIPDGEYNLAWCLNRIVEDAASEDFIKIQELLVTRQDEVFKYKVKNLQGEYEEYKITNYKIIVKK